jgi:hypothetical protein
VGSAGWNFGNEFDLSFSGDLLIGNNMIKFRYLWFGRIDSSCYACAAICFLNNFSYTLKRNLCIKCECASIFNMFEE